MPGSPWPIFFWLKEIKELVVRRSCLAVGPMFTAAALTILVAVLLFTVVGGLKNAAHEAPKAKLAQTDVAVPPIQVVGRENKVPAAVAEPKPKTDAAAVITIAEKPVRPVFTGEEIPLWPVRGKVKLDMGWYQHPVFNDWRYHTGIDIETSAGSAVGALYDGEVASVYEDKDYGLMVVISSGPYTVYYGSLATVTVAKGQYTSAGAKIGTVGSCSGEPYIHLHLAIKSNGKYANPQEILSKAR